MPRGNYTGKLTHLEIIELFHQGKYSCDLETGDVFSGKTGKKLFMFIGNDEGMLWTRLYASPKMRSLTVSHIIWIIGNQIAIPEGFQIHHRNVQNTDNRYENLFALFHLDHKKLHNNEDLIARFDGDDEIPF